jgi:hypothetical protein
VAVYQERPDALNQGDLIQEVPFTIPLGNERSVKVMLGLVLQHDCDCDKFLKPRTPIPEEQQPAWAITVAPAHPISDLTGGRPKAVREGNMSRYFWLPAEGDVDELVADLWLEQPIPIVQLLERRRVASLSDDWRLRLWAQVFDLRTRLDPADVFAGGRLSAS